MYFSTRVTYSNSEAIFHGESYSYGVHSFLLFLQNMFLFQTKFLCVEAAKDLDYGKIDVPTLRLLGNDTF